MPNTAILAAIPFGTTSSWGGRVCARLEGCGHMVRDALQGERSSPWGLAEHRSPHWAAAKMRGPRPRMPHALHPGYACWRADPDGW